MLPALAFLGFDAPPSLRAAVLGLQPHRVRELEDELLAAKVLERRGGRLDLAHPLMAELWCGGLSTGERRRLGERGRRAVLAARIAICGDSTPPLRRRRRSARTSTGSWRGRSTSLVAWVRRSCATAGSFAACRRRALEAIGERANADRLWHEACGIHASQRAAAGVPRAGDRIGLGWARAWVASRRGDWQAVLEQCARASNARGRERGMAASGSGCASRRGLCCSRCARSSKWRTRPRRSTPAMGASALLGDVGREFAATPMGGLPQLQARFGPPVRPDEAAASGSAVTVRAHEAADDSLSRDHVRLFTFGPLRVLPAGEIEPLTRSAWGSRKARLLLAVFLAEDLAGRGVEREHLLDAVWPDSDSLKLENTFHVTINRLRNALEGDGSGRDRLLVFEDGRYHLATGRIWSDVRAFEEALARAARRQRAGSAGEALTAIRSAFDLYQGEFLSDLDELWIEPARERLRSRFVEAGRSIAEAEIAGGRFDDAQVVAERMVSCDPLSEVGHQLLMRVYLCSGRRDAAKRQLERCRSLLADELQIAVSAETEALIGDRS